MSCSIYVYGITIFEIILTFDVHQYIDQFHPIYLPSIMKTIKRISNLTIQKTQKALDDKYRFI